MRSIILPFLLLLLVGCSTSNVSNSEIDKANQRVLVFQDLLRQGWDIHTVRGKVVLIKQTQEGLLIQDVFEVLEEEDSLW